LFLAQPRLLSDLNNGLSYNERKVCKRRTVMTEEIRLKEGIMAEEIRVVEHYSASIANKVGEGARVLGALRDGGVNLIAFWGYKHGEGRALSAKSEETQPKNSPQEEQQVRASFARVARGRLDSLQNEFLPD